MLACFQAIKLEKNCVVLLPLNIVIREEESSNLTLIFQCADSLSVRMGTPEVRT